MAQIVACFQPDPKADWWAVFFIERSVAHSRMMAF
jgi:hypothetical protein